MWSTELGAKAILNEKQKTKQKLPMQTILSKRGDSLLNNYNKRKEKWFIAKKMNCWESIFKASEAEIKEQILVQIKTILFYKKVNKWILTIKLISICNATITSNYLTYMHLLS